MSRYDQSRVGLQAGLREPREIALMALHRLRGVDVSEKNDAPPSESRQMQGGAPCAERIIAADRAVGLLRQLGTPDREA